MSVGGAGLDLGRKAFDLAQRVKAMLSPLEDVCRYREQRQSDYARYDVRPARADALPFAIAVAPGGVNIDTESFSIREFPVTEAGVVEEIVAAILAGRVRRVVARAASGKAKAAKTYVFGADGKIVYRHSRKAGPLAALAKTAAFERRRFAPYRPAADPAT